MSLKVLNYLILNNNFPISILRLIGTKVLTTIDYTSNNNLQGSVEAAERSCSNLKAKFADVIHEPGKLDLFLIFFKKKKIY